MSDLGDKFFSFVFHVCLSAAVVYLMIEYPYVRYVVFAIAILAIGAMVTGILVVQYLNEGLFYKSVNIIAVIAFMCAASVFLSYLFGGLKA